jgi:hypothetical protein
MAANPSSAKSLAGGSPRGMQQEDCGAPVGRHPTAVSGSLSAPRLRRYCSPHLHLPRCTVRARIPTAAGPRLPSRGGREWTPEAVPLPMTRLSGLQLVSGHLYRAFLGRRIPSPEKQTVCSSRPHGRGMEAVYARFGTRGQSGESASIAEEVVQQPIGRGLGRLIFLGLGLRRGLGRGLLLSRCVI